MIPLSMDSSILILMVSNGNSSWTDIAIPCLTLAA